MNWIDSFFVIMTFSCMTGSIFYVLWLLFSEKIWRQLNPYISYAGLKLSLIIVFLPISYNIIIATQTNKEIVTTVLDRTTPIIKRNIRVLCAIWFAGIIVFGTLQALRQKRFNKAVKVRVPVDEHTMEILERQKNLLHITKVIDVYQCYNTTVPFITGIIKPTIYIPVEEYTDKELELIFMHELYHYKHHDTIWRKISVASSVVFWYNPLLLTSTYYVSRWAEACCDASCMKHYQAKEYFVTLLDMKNRDDDSNIPAFTLRGEDKQILWRIVTMRRRMKTRGRGFIAATSVACAVAVGSMGCSKAAGLINDMYYEYYMSTINAVPVDSDTEYVWVDDGKPEMTVSLADELGDIPVVEPTTLTPNFISAQISDILPGQTLITGVLTLEVGEKVNITSYGNPENKSYDIGIMSMSGDTKYVTGTADQQHQFTIEKDGKYSIFVRNESDVTMDIELMARRITTQTK